MANNAYIHYLEVDDENSGPLRITDAAGNVFPTETKWGSFHCLGQHLSFSGLKDGSGRQSQNFRVFLNVSTPEMISTLFNHTIVDNDVCVHLAKGVPVEGPAGLQYEFSQPEILKLGRISNISSSPRGIVATCYTASADLGSVSTTATRWEDAQHRLFVDPNDYGFRFAAKYWEDQGIITG